MSRTHREAAGHRFQCSLLGGFQLLDDAGAVSLPRNSQRLLAFLALQSRPATRAVTSGALWPDTSEARAYASLRSALTRLDPTTRHSLQITPSELRLADGVRVDYREAQALAQRLFAGTDTPEDMTRASIAVLSQDLLPHWYEDWVLAESEHWRQVRLHALEQLAARLTEAARFGDAVSAAIAAIEADPLRESGYASLVRVHLAEGNQAEALSAFMRFRTLLGHELGVEPTLQFRSLIAHLRPRDQYASAGDRGMRRLETSTGALTS